MTRKYFLDISKNLTANQELILGIDSGSSTKRIAVKFALTGADGSITAQSSENAQFSGGTKIIGKDYDRNKQSNPVAIVYDSPTVQKVGDILRKIYAGQNKVNGNVNFEEYTILKPKTKYLIKIKNESSQNNNVVISMSWFEK